MQNRKDWQRKQKTNLDDEELAYDTTLRDTKYMSRESKTRDRITKIAAGEKKEPARIDWNFNNFGRERIRLVL